MSRKITYLDGRDNHTRTIRFLVRAQLVSLSFIRRSSSVFMCRGHLNRKRNSSITLFSLREVFVSPIHTRIHSYYYVIKWRGVLKIFFFLRNKPRFSNFPFEFNPSALLRRRLAFKCALITIDLTTYKSLKNAKTKLFFF